MAIHRMPRFTPRLQKISNAYYRIEFLEDGFPGKRMHNGVFAHPIYGIYVLNDYLFQYRKHGAPSLRNGIITVADAVLRRMRTYRGALVFWYEADSPFNSSNERYFSGLTQAYYAKVLAEVYQAIGTPRYKRAAQKTFRSLRIPVFDGGVYHLSSVGPSVQEYPMAPNGYVLNGWLSIILAMHTYAGIIGDKDAHVFIAKNVQALKRLLPLYDVPAYANSRYTLNGHRYVRLSTSIDNVQLNDTRLIVPDEGTYSFTLKQKSNRWENYIVTDSVQQSSGRVYMKHYRALLNVLFSRFSYPQENRLQLSVTSPRATVMHIHIATGQYDATQSSPVQPTWTHVHSVSLSPGKNDLCLPIPWTLLELVGHPTTFKKIGSAYYNVYHFIHIHRLKTLAELTSDNTFLTRARMWEAYVQTWPGLSMYANTEHRPYQ